MYGNLYKLKLLFDDNKIKMAKNPVKIWMKNPVR